MVKNGNLILKPLIIKKTSRSKNRVWEVDFLRGLCIVLMLFDHLMYNFAFMDQMAYNWHSVESNFFIGMQAAASWYWNLDARNIIRVTVVFLFLFLSGISCSFSKHNGKRFLKMSAAACIVMLATFGLDWIIGGGMFILFGILHIMAVSIGFYCLIKLVFRKFTPIAALLFGSTIFGFGFTTGFYTGYLPSLYFGGGHGRQPNFAYFWWIAILSFAVIAIFMIKFLTGKFSHKFVYGIKSRAKSGNTPQFNLKKLKGERNALIFEYLIVAVGIIGLSLIFTLLPRDSMGTDGFWDLYSLFIGTGSFGADFYGIFPFTGIFLIGSAIGAILYKNKRSLVPKLNVQITKGYSFTGRNAIWMYLSHQVVFFGIVMLSAMAAGYRF